MRSDAIDADAILEMVRPAILVISGTGQIVDARGCAGGFLGWRASDLAGRSVFEFVADEHVDEVATYFGKLADDDSVRSVPMPMPFRVHIVSAGGESELVDVVPTGCVEAGETWGWVVVLMPLAMQSSPTRSLVAELAGHPRTEVRERLTEELSYDNSWGRLVWYFVDLTDPDTGPTLTEPRGEPDAASVLRSAIAGGWMPWACEPDGFASDVPSTTFFAPTVTPRLMPSEVHTALHDAGWTRLFGVPVELHGEVVGTYLALARTPPEDDLAVRTNSDQRISSLLDVTRLLIQRWRNQDRLVLAATSDSLTGVANRDTFLDALQAVEGPYAVLYVDIDNFKDVNDRWGHAVGDQLLVELSRRISRSVAPDDLVARFGGDEFVVLLRGIDASAAVEVGRRVLGAASAPLHLDRGPDQVTISVGLADASAGDDPIDAADRAMLTAKRLGRGRVVSA